MIIIVIDALIGISSDVKLHLNKIPQILLRIEEDISRD